MRFGLDELSTNPPWAPESSAGLSFGLDVSEGSARGGDEEASEAIFLMEQEASRGDGKDVNSSSSDWISLPYSESFSARRCPFKAGEEAADEG